ncbi:MAG: MFS transporter [Anaerolineae bacterium]|nr:MFS transporter [Anaerolineae bacterium]
MDEKARPSLAPAFLSMVLLGALSVMVGALLPAIIQSLALNDAQAGLLVSSPAVGYVLAAALAGIMGDALGFRRVWLIGVGMGLLAILGIALAPSFAWLLPAVGATGLVAGLCDGSINPLIALLAQGRSGGVLNRVHLFFGIGATVTPFLIGLGLRLGLPWRAHYFLLSCYLLLVGASIRRARFPQREKLPPTSLPPRWQLIKTIPFALLAIFIYGGVEASIFSWTATYLERRALASLATSSLGVSLFGIAMMVGRLLCSFAAERIGYKRLIIGGALGGAAALSMLLLAPGPFLPWVGLGLAGLALAGIFATIMADVTQRVSQRAGTVAGATCSSSGLGKILLPWLVGQVAQATNLEAALWLVVFGAVAIAAAYACT